jgi:hypothetical protein
MALGKKSILDGLGLALSGSVAETGRLSRAYLKSLGLSAGEATVIGTSMKAPVRFAAFVNGIGIHADDYDDTQLAVAKDRVYGLLTHPTAPTLASGLAKAEARGMSGRDLLLAYHIGVEVECKVAEAILPRTMMRVFHSTGTCAHLRPPRRSPSCRASSARIYCAGIAGGQPACVRISARCQAVSCRPCGGVRGVVAADLAELGWTAADKILEAPRGFFHAAGSGYDLNAIQNKLGNPWTFHCPGLHQTVPIGSLHASWHDEMLRLIRATKSKRGMWKRERRHERNMQRAHPSSAEGLTQAKFSMSSPCPLLLLKGGLERFTVKCQPPRGAEHDQTDPPSHPVAEPAIADDTIEFNCRTVERFQGAISEKARLIR